MRAVLLLVCALSAVLAQDFPLCEVCGCPTCESGLYPVGALNGLIPIPPGLESVSPEDFTQISCAFLEFLGSSGEISPEICDSGFRLDPSFRSACGCPLLPGFTAMPTDAPVTMAPTTTSPTLSPTPPAPTLSPTSFLEALEFCSVDGEVNFDDNIFFTSGLYNSVVHSDDFKPICFCTSDTNILDVYFYLEEAFISEDATELSEINARAASIDHSVSFSCRNECSVCFPDGECAIILNLQDQRAFGTMPDFTSDEITEDFFYSDEFFERILADPGVAHNISTCATFVSGIEDEICLNIEWAGPDFFFPQRTNCDITVNGVSCSTCLAVSVDEFGEQACITADCTNIENGEMVDTCNGEPASALYQPLDLFTNPSSYFGLLEAECSQVTESPTPSITGAPTPAITDPPTPPTGFTESPTPAVTEPPHEPVSSPLPMTQAPTEPPIILPTIERCQRLR